MRGNAAVSIVSICAVGLHLFQHMKYFGRAYDLPRPRRGHNHVSILCRGTTPFSSISRAIDRSARAAGEVAEAAIVLSEIGFTDCVRPPAVRRVSVSRNTT